MTEKNNFAVLDYWEEYMGRYKGMEITDAVLNVLLFVNSKILKLSFPLHSHDAECITNFLKNCKEGERISVLKTDMPKRPIVIRKLFHTPNAGIHTK